MDATYDFKEQVALVTGAGSVMGLTTARAYAAAGASVVLADVKDAALASEVDSLTSADSKASGVTYHVSNEEQVAAMVQRTVDTYGRPHSERMRTRR